VKPTPKYDFPVLVSSEIEEHPSSDAAFYADIFEVQLNRAVSFYVMPQFSREPWPPVGIERPSTLSDACRSLAAAVRFSVTVDPARAEMTDTFVDDEGAAHTLFYVSEREYVLLNSELRALVAGDQHEVRLVSMVPPMLRDLILSRILSSGLLTSYAMSMLGRSKHGKGQRQGER